MEAWWSWERTASTEQRAADAARGTAEQSRCTRAPSGVRRRGSAGTARIQSDLCSGTFQEKGAFCGSPTARQVAGCSSRRGSDCSSEERGSALAAVPSLCVSALFNKAARRCWRAGLQASRRRWCAGRQASRPSSGLQQSSRKSAASAVSAEAAGRKSAASAEAAGRKSAASLSVAFQLVSAESGFAVSSPAGLSARVEIFR